MTQPPLRLILLTRDSTPRIAKAQAWISDFLKSQADVEIVAEGIIEDTKPNGYDADLAVVLGGDGAILRACRLFGSDQIPLIGVNLGRLGFLADLQPEELKERFSSLRNREYTIVENLMYRSVLIRATGEREDFLGLNEVAVISQCMGICDTSLTIDGNAVADYSADGLIISTPVGSTAHSLSAGGPILRQNLPAFVVTPICPHTLTNRPLVDSADSLYEMTLERSTGGAVLVIDGQIRRDLEPGDRIEVRRAEVTFKLAKLPGHSYYATLHRKLGWAGQPHYRVDPEAG
ncbi:NAD(+)/NADH kinase [Stratiformator vulcanicus]|uniref:NAD kinase n=1 Tax=Stratiformator vulcanicus TaxID=2527980 RepID=A0A517R250_9PLAN|nr:NAD(+)/NADH kinase [Stratiformator vulcanicus]QDT37923.1 putative inorganic polyphosphate/ATP-NAD kinase [Stratiformator vulcanicus]